MIKISILTLIAAVSLVQLSAFILGSADAQSVEAIEEPRNGWQRAGDGVTFNKNCEYRALLDSGELNPNGYYYMDIVFPHQLVHFTDGNTFVILPTTRHIMVQAGQATGRTVLKLERRC